MSTKVVSLKNWNYKSTIHKSIKFESNETVKGISSYYYCKLWKSDRNAPQLVIKVAIQLKNKNTAKQGLSIWNYLGTYFYCWNK